MRLLAGDKVVIAMIREKNKAFAGRTGHSLTVHKRQKAEINQGEQLYRR